MNLSVNFITEACEGTLNKYAAKFKTNLDMRAVKSWSLSNFKRIGVSALARSSHRAQRL